MVWHGCENETNGYIRKYLYLFLVWKSINQSYMLKPMGRDNDNKISNKNNTFYTELWWSPAFVWVVTPFWHHKFLLCSDANKEWQWKNTSVGTYRSYCNFVGKKLGEAGSFTYESLLTEKRTTRTTWLLVRRWFHTALPLQWQDATGCKDKREFSTFNFGFMVILCLFFLLSSDKREKHRKNPLIRQQCNVPMIASEMKTWKRPLL